jgi:MFS family permease
MILSSAGQTFFISLFSDAFRTHYAIGDGSLGAVFAIATFASALALPYLGQKIDAVSLRKFTLGAGLLLGLACAMIALSPASVIVFGICLFLLRLAGQGLMVHTAMTAMIRFFPADSGKAMAVVSLVYSAALVFIPAAAVAVIGFSGWRGTWLFTGAAVVFGVCTACHLLPRDDAASSAAKVSNPLSQPGVARPKLGLMLLLCPTMLAVSFILTAMIFHQAVLATEKGWPLEWLAGCFSAFAIAQAVTSVLVAPLIDRIRVLPVFLLPLAMGLGIIALFDSLWAAPLYMGLLGISAAIDLKLGTILWADLFGAGQFGYVRSRFEAIRIVITGSAPLIAGKLLDAGIPLANQAAAYVCYSIGASALAVVAGRFACKAHK